MTRLFKSILTFLSAGLTIGQSTAQDLRLILPIQQGINIRSAEFSPDQNYIVSTQDQTVKIWEVATGRVIRNIACKTESASFSHNGKYVLTGAGKVYNADNGTLIFSTTAFLCAFSKNDSLIAGTEDKDICLFDLSGQVMDRIPTGKGQYERRAIFSPDETNILVTADSSVDIYNINGHTLVSHFRESAFLRWASYCPDGNKIVTSSVDTIIRIWNAASGKLIDSLKGHVQLIATANYSPDGKHVVSASYDGSIKVWNADSWKPELSWVAHNDRVNSASYSADGQWIVSASWDKSVKVWNASDGHLIKNYIGSMNLINSATYRSDGKELAMVTDSFSKVIDQRSLRIVRNLNENKPFMQEAVFSPDGKLLVTKGAVGFEPSVWDLSADTLVGHLPGYDNWVTTMNFSRDGKYFATFSIVNNMLRIWEMSPVKKVLDVSLPDNKDLPISINFDNNNNVLLPLGKSVFLLSHETGKPLRVFPGHRDRVLTAVYSSGFDRILSASDDSTVRIFNARSGKILHTFKDTASLISAIYSPDDGVLLTWSNGGIIKVRDTSDGKLRYVLNDAGHPLRYPTFSADGRVIKTVAGSETVEFWDAATGKLIYTYALLFKDDFFSILNSKNGIGYYYGTKNAIKQLSFELNGKRFPFEQFDLQYNRPDKVLEKLPGADKALIGSYKRAYLKRLEREGFKEPDFDGNLHLPNLQLISSSDKIQVTRKKFFTLRFIASDSLYLLDRYLITVNEVPVTPVGGYSIRSLETKKKEVEISIGLIDPVNKIQVSCMNVKGASSLKETIYVNYQPAEPPPASMTWFIGFGISHYNSPGHTLNYAAKDIVSLDSLFRSGYQGNYKSIILLDTAVTNDGLLAIRDSLRKTNIQDRVIIAFSGHGLVDDSLDFYFATGKTDFSKPRQTGIAYGAVESLLDDIPARKKLLLIDACHSGEIDKKEITQETSVAASDDLAIALENAGLAVEQQSKGAGLGLQNSFELMKELFEDVSQSNGALIISAARGNEYANEGDKWGSGVFTYAIKTALTGNHLTIGQLKEYVCQKVDEWTNGGQKPTARRDLLDYDWWIW